MSISNLYQRIHRVAFSETAISVALLLLIWMLAAGPLGLPGYVLPTPWAVAVEWFEAASSGRLFVDTSISLYRLLLGAAAGLSTGIVFGFLVGLSTNARTAFEPIINAMSGIAGIAWIPLALAWFGVGLSMSTFVIWNGMFFVVFANTALGVSRVPASLRESVLTLGGGRSEVLRSVIFPGALPDILTGARVGLAFAWRSLLAAELLGAPQGLGQWINQAATLQRTDRILAGCITIALLGVVLEYLLVSWISSRTVVRWGTINETAKGV
jgi:ABC-type nitrate/sulfonate/bicarbonate transport system permease component